jgi:flagellar biosynthesis/type III secretory pathway protein FliH
MILRNVSVSAERRALVPSAKLPPREAAVRRTSHLEVVAPAADRPPQSPDDVSGWLAQQPAEVRAACARVLAVELDAVRASAHAEGIEQGRVQGLREASDRALATLTSLEAMVSDAERAFEAERAQLAEGCVEVVAEVFSKLAGPELVRREAVVSVVLEVLARVRDQRELTIRVSALDLPVLKAAEPQLTAALGTRRWTITADPRVSLGGCLVESTLGTLDGRLEVQLRELYHTLLAAKAARAEEP